jgi:hypothetical protein
MNSYILNLNNLKFIFISSSSGSACFCIKGVIVSAIGFGQIVSSIHPALAPSPPPMVRVLMMRVMIMGLYRNTILAVSGLKAGSASMMVPLSKHGVHGYVVIGLPYIGLFCL